MPAYGSEFLWLVDFGPTYTGLGSGGTNTVKWSIRTKLDAALAGYDWTAGVLELAGACGQYVVVIPANAFAAAGDYVLRCRTSDASTIYASQELIVSAPAPTAAAVAALPTDATIQADAAAAITADAKVTAIKGKTDLIPAAGPPDAAVYTATRGAKLNNLDTNVGSRSSHSAADVATAVWNTLTSALSSPSSVGAWVMAKLDTNVGSRTSGTIPDATALEAAATAALAADAQVGTAGTIATNLDQKISAIPAAPSVTQIAADVTTIKDNTPRIR